VHDEGGCRSGVVVSAANVQDRDGAVTLLRACAGRGRPRPEHAWADHGYHGDYRAWAESEFGIEIEIVEQDPEAKGEGFQVLPCRWVVERTNAWISRRRRCARDYERLPAHHAGMVQIAVIIQMTRRLARATAGAANVAAS
jgi:putative transposase